MRDVVPTVYLIARPQINPDAVVRYLRDIGAEAFIDMRWLDQDDWMRGQPPATTLSELCGRLCYRSWAPGLNPNVTKIREDQKEYIVNVLNSKHGSVLEHGSYSFIIANVSRVFTHELVRHRAGSAFSQESMRYVRLDDIPFWNPDWAKEDDELMARNADVLHTLEEHQRWLADHFKLDDGVVPFTEKKAKTSYMRRFAPEGVATSIVWSANIRTLRWVIEQRTATSAEEEIRIVLDEVAEQMHAAEPMMFQDFMVDDEGQWKPLNSKV